MLRPDPKQNPGVPGIDPGRIYLLEAALRTSMRAS
jgi:hypothetical protein